mgnify:CR=1 FL=1
MKPSEMTNEELAARLEKVLPGNYYIVEAAKRLRNVTIRSDNSAVIAELERRLTVAEDALGKVYKCINNRYGVDASILAKNIIADALAAIRGEWDNNNNENK